MRGRNGGAPDNGGDPLLAETAAFDLRPPSPPGHSLWASATQPRKGPTWLRALLGVAVVALAGYLLAVRARPKSPCVLAERQQAWSKQLHSRMSMHATSIANVIFCGAQDRVRSAAAHLPDCRYA